jgi:HAD superfamily hydrolase (TIGR01509 family)
MIKLQNIDAILFDMMGVLLFQKSNYVPDTLVDEIDILVGRVTDDTAFKQETLKKFRLSEADFNNILSKIVNKYEPFQELWNLLPELRKHYKLAIINNGTGLTIPQFGEKLNFENHFDIFVSSAKEGIKKPAGEIFLTTTNRLGVVPERCLFMDDSEMNIDGAKRIGMQTIFWPNKDEGFKMFAELIGT